MTKFKCEKCGKEEEADAAPECCEQPMTEAPAEAPAEEAAPEAPAEEAPAEAPAEEAAPEAPAEEKPAEGGCCDEGEKKEE